MSKLIPESNQTHLPDIRTSYTHRRVICGFKCYITVSFLESEDVKEAARPGEVFVKIAKHGSVIAGLMDGLCALTSVSLQYGVPWEIIKARFEHHVFGSENDQQHSSLLDGLVQGVDQLIEHRRGIIDDTDVGESTNA